MDTETEWMLIRDFAPGRSGENNEDKTKYIWQKNLPEKLYGVRSYISYGYVV